MDSFSTDGIVLQVRYTGESDRIVTVLTREHGVIRAFAKAARRPKSKLHAATQAFCFSDFTFQKSGEAYRVIEATPKEVFYRLNDDIAKLSLAQYFGQLAGELVAADERNPENLRLILNSLYFLCNNKKDPVWLKAVTEMRLCANCGYAPDLTGCSACGVPAAQQERMYFNLSAGVLLCRRCGNSYSGVAVNRSVLSALLHVILSDFDRLYTFSIAPGDLQDLASICEKYILIQTERQFSSLDFYKKMADL